MGHRAVVHRRIVDDLVTAAVPSAELGLATPASPSRSPDHARRAIAGALCLSALLHGGILTLAERTPVPLDAGGEPMEMITVDVIEDVLVAMPDTAPAEAWSKDEPAPNIAPVQQPAPIPGPTAPSLPQPRARPRPSTTSRPPETSHAPPPQSPTPEKDNPTNDRASGLAKVDNPATPGAADDPPAPTAGQLPGQKDGGGRGSASPAGSMSPVSAQRLLDAYGRDLWKRIAAHKPKGLQLVASTGISFVVAADGTLLTLSISRSSGRSELDHLALQAVRLAAPLPPLPSALGVRPMTFEISFNFR